jgi:site-specific recombinase XerD
VQTYGEAVDQLIGHVARRKVVQADRIQTEHVETFMEHLLATRSPATASNRYRALQQFFAWLVEEEVIAVSPMAKMKPPAVPEQPVPILRDDEVRALLATCSGKTLEDRRDEAIIRLLYDTGMRRAELLGMTVSDLDLDGQIAFVVGKGRRHRACPFGAKTGRAIDRYLRLRDRHRYAETDALWVQRRGRLNESGIATLLRRRGERAGIGAVHPHQFRHGFAHAFLSAGGQEQDLMRLVGWRGRDMLARYGAVAADERAREAARRLSLGDRL